MSEQKAPHTRCVAILGCDVVQHGFWQGGGEPCEKVGVATSLHCSVWKARTTDTIAA